MNEVAKLQIYRQGTRQSSNNAEYNQTYRRRYLNAQATCYRTCLGKSGHPEWVVYTSINSRIRVTPYILTCFTVLNKTVNFAFS
jgi:hypothetical protein